ncbi:MFS transporter [Novosphingobium sp. FSY-8]|uniref:MFS transporter n=1 Tax=Novosphingobium ovatum TaxID=1908523 RepID=A0ABW9X9X4_9SPHN|nr:MFS transporter [Novosphingobium ovatum]NBC35341.1 MFS transporter [Novosphingobium ovatum]
MISTGRVRYGVLAMLFVATLINYADRATLSLAAPVLSADLGIDKLALGVVFSAFGWAYVAVQVPGGWLLDRFGAPRVYLAAIVLWSAFTAMQGAVVWASGSTAITLLFALRFLVGLAEGPSFPGNARIVAAWFPARERGTASAIFNSAQYFATVLFAPIMGWIIHGFGWPWVFVFMGAVGMGVAVIWARVVCDPADHPRLTDAERALIAEGAPPADPATLAPVPMGRALRVLLTDRTLVGLYLAQFFITTLTYFFLTWFPVYLVEERHLSIVDAGLFSVVPAVCGFVGGVLGGVWSDWLLRRGASATVARKVPMASGMLIALSILGCNYVTSDAMVLLCMSAAFFGKGVGALGWAVMADVAPRRAGGLSGGIFNMFGNSAAIITPIVIGYVLKVTGSFDLVLALVAGCALASVVCVVAVMGRITRIELTD